MKFKIIKQSKKTSARVGVLETHHSKIATPVFMPCATSGSVKGVSMKELSDIGFKIILGNTYHLYLRPGEELVQKMGGLQKFINWPESMLTDSGGYQVFSLSDNYKVYGVKTESLTQVVKRGVWFRSHLDGSKHLFTPEKVIDIQLALGSDIIMPLDFCPSADATKEEIEKAVDLTNIWFKQAFEHFAEKTKDMKKRPAIFAIIQGGFYKDLREKSYNFLSQFPVDGFSIGGVANGGESKTKQRKALLYTLPLIPKDKPRYLMGVGEPEDIIYAVGHGIDMFDCVLPTRLGRHGVAWTTKNWKKFEKIDLRKTRLKEDKNPIMENCGCEACSGGYARSYISHLIRSKEMLGMRLISLHNLWLLHELMRKIRANELGHF